MGEDLKTEGQQTSMLKGNIFNNYYEKFIFDYRRQYTDKYKWVEF